MTVQTLGLCSSKSFSSLNLEEFLNFDQSLDLPVPANYDVGDGFCFSEKRNLTFPLAEPSPLATPWESPDLEGEEQFTFMGLDEKPATGLRPSSITQAPLCTSSGALQIITTGNNVETVGTSPHTSRPSPVTSVSPMATRLRTGTQLRRTIATADSISGSSSTSPRSSSTPRYGDDVGNTHLEDLPEMKFKRGKRKKEVDLDTIDDPDERRKQRRLAKNRATAALSRQRKRDQMAMLIERVRNMDATITGLNATITDMKVEMARLQRENEVKEMENNRLRGELANHNSGVGGATESEVSAPAREPAVLSGASPMRMLPSRGLGLDADVFDDDFICGILGQD